MKDMTKGSPNKLILSFLIPLLIGNIFQQLYSMVDTIIVGQFVGIDALAGVGSTSGLYFLMIGFILGITNGFSIPIAQAFGSEDADKVRHYSITSIYLCIIMSVVLTILGAIFTKPILILMSTPDNIFEHAYSYILILNLGISTTIFYNVLGSISRALGDSKTPLYFLILSSVLNIVLDLVLILNFSMGVKGAALATVISQGVSALLCIFYMYKKFKILRFTKKDLYFSKKSCKHLLKIGIPMGLQSSIVAIGTIILQSAVNTLGYLAVASFTAASKVEMLVFQPALALGSAIATYTSQNLGAGKLDRISAGVKSAVLICFGMAILFGVFVAFSGDFLIGIFVNEPDPEKTSIILEYGSQYLKVSSISLIFIFLLVMYRSALQGTGSTVIPMISSILDLSGRCIVAFVLVSKIGFSAICIAGPLAWIFACAALVPSHYLNMRKLKNIYNKSS